MTTFQAVQLSLQALSAAAVIVGLALAVRTLRLNLAAYRDLHEWNRRKAAYDAVAKYREFAEDGRKIRETFDINDGFDPLPLAIIKEKFKADTTLRIAVIRVLNFYEELAIGILHGVFDEAIVRNTLQTTISRSYTRFSEYILHMRHNTSPGAYVDCEALVNRWRAEALRAPERHGTGVAA